MKMLGCRNSRLIAAAILLLSLVLQARLGAQTQSGSTARFPQLVDITASTGIHFNHLSSPAQRYIVESMSGGVAIIDYDGDGWPDLYFTNAPSVAMALDGKKARSALFHNNHDGTFTDVTEKAGVGYPCWAMGVAVGDFNNDGRPDLVVSCFGGVVLYRNNGDGTFTNVTKAAGLDKDSGWATGVAFGDYDGDGNQDLFVAHYVDLDLHNLPEFGARKTCQYHEIAVQCGPRGLKGSPDALYHNNGDGTFTEVAEQAGVNDANKFFGLAAVWSDFDNDGKLDLFVANDGGPNYLYHNEGNGHFKEIAFDSGAAVSEDGQEQANMGVAVGDYLNNGRMSIFVSHFSEEYATLYRNDGGLSFTDVSHAAGAARPTVPFVGWGDAFVDLDNSGWQDLILVNGHVYPQVDDAKIGTSYREPKLVFQNQRDGTFKDISAQVGPAMGVPQVSRGLAVGDLFNRGSLDVVVENIEGEPMILETKSNPAHHWVSFDLEGSPANRLALNARIRITTGKLQQTGEVRSGGSYLSQNDLRLHFGLGDVSRIDKVEVFWPNGKTQEFENVAGDCFYHLKQGGALTQGKEMEHATSSSKR
ncbi:CRTAC1 family protein [Edaphobacter bradus]|uniref:CRTAC1 family protein n=1 Tax=Edaphobacter bradus TaxID=2259016 RepID=UPI0021E0F204|nr:CRTAC1 family protein [Edaphobacter bradus]